MKKDYILQVEHLNKSYYDKKIEKKALIDVSFKVEKGEIFGIIGESGSGNLP